jgi:hypothetical protein
MILSSALYWLLLCVRGVNSQVYEFCCLGELVLGLGTGTFKVLIICYVMHTEDLYQSHLKGNILVVSPFLRCNPKDRDDPVSLSFFLALSQMFAQSADIAPGMIVNQAVSFPKISKPAGEDKQIYSL